MDFSLKLLLSLSIGLSQLQSPQCSHVLGTTPSRAAYCTVHTRYSVYCTVPPGTVVPGMDCAVSPSTTAALCTYMDPILHCCVVWAWSLLPSAPQIRLCTCPQLPTLLHWPTPAPRNAAPEGGGGEPRDCLLLQPEQLVEQWPDNSPGTTI